MTAIFLLLIRRKLGTDLGKRALPKNRELCGGSDDLRSGKHDSAFKARLILCRKTAVGIKEIGLFHVVQRMQKAGGKRTVIREKQESFGFLIQPADRKKITEIRGKGIHNRFSICILSRR